MSSHIEFRFTLWFYIVSDIVNFNNLFRRQFEKSILNFDYLFDIVFKNLYV